MKTILAIFFFVVYLFVSGEFITWLLNQSYDVTFYLGWFLILINIVAMLHFVWWAFKRIVNQ